MEILRRNFRCWIPAGGRPKFELKCVTEKEIAEMISKLKNGHAFGIDRIDSFTIKMAAKTLIPVITHVINLSLSSAKFPGCWKLARILPLLKGKDSNPNNNPSSYRLVSQLPVISKLVERSVQWQLLQYLEETSQLSEHHHVYRNYHNTVLIHLMDGIAMSRHELHATKNIDLTAAFDCVPHQTMKDKLDLYGLDQRTKDCISSYLEARSSFVAIGSSESRITATPQGVPQGSVIGPLLYLVFVNEMTGVVEDKDCLNPVHQQQDKLFSRDCNICGIFPMYADDGQFQVANNNRDWNQDKIERNLWEIKNYLKSNGF